jgi:hypothetical protein
MRLLCTGSRNCFKRELLKVGGLLLQEAVLPASGVMVGVTVVVSMYKAVVYQQLIALCSYTSAELEWLICIWCVVQRQLTESRSGCCGCVALLLQP